MTDGPQNSAHLSQRRGQVRQHLNCVAAPDDVETCRLLDQVLSDSQTDRDLVAEPEPGILHRGLGSLDIPRHRVDADSGRAVAAAQLDQVAGVAAADIEDALTGVEGRIGDLVQLIRACGFEAGVEFVEQSSERLAADLGHAHSRKHPQPPAKTSSSASQDDRRAGRRQ